MQDVATRLAASQPETLLLLLLAIAIAAITVVWVYVRLQAIRDLKADQQRILLEMHALRTVLESLDHRTREIREQSTDDSLRLREDLLTRADGVRLAVTRDLG